MIRRQLVHARLAAARQRRGEIARFEDEPAIPTLADEMDMEYMIHDAILHEQLRVVESDPALIANLAEPLLDVQLLAVDHDPMSLGMITNPYPEVRLLAVLRDPSTIRFIERPTNQEAYLALSRDPNTYDLFKPTFSHFLIWLFVAKKFTPIP